MANNNKHTGPNVPALRFPEFSGEWETRTIGDDCKILMCKRIFANQTAPEGEVPFYKIGTIGDKADAYISKELFDEYKLKYNYPKCGEVMITCAGTVGKTILYNGQDAYYQDSNIVWLSNPKNFYSNAFLNYLLNRVDWSKLNSTTITRIYNDNLRELHITFPSRQEQDRIVSLLTKIDERITVQSKIIEELKTLRSSLRQKLLYKNDVVMRPLSDFSELKNGYAFKSSTYSDTGIYNIVTISNVTGERYINLVGYNKIDEIPFDIQSHQILHSGDILISMTGNVGRVSMCSDGNYLLNQRVGLLKLKAEYVGFTEYIFQCLRDISFTNAMKDKGQGAAQQNIGKGDIESFMVPWFNDVRYSKSVSQLLYKLDNIVLIEEQRLSDYSKIKIGLLSKMFI